jgi:ribonuclease HII
MSGSGRFDQAGLFGELSLDLDPISLDETFRRRGYRLLAGVDEAGRGPLAGPVVAAAVILPKGCVISGLTDSKALSASERERLSHIILHCAISVGVGSVEADVIDRINILQATVLAMEEAVSRLKPSPQALLIDGPRGIGYPSPQFPLVKGDARSQAIAAASVVAKVTRDRIMTHYHTLFPHYRFDRHKGYGTQAHLDALRKHGCCPVHRKSFRGVTYGPPTTRQRPR